MKLGVLLALLGLFAIGSGWLKSRARVRDRMDGAGLGVAEGALGLVLLVSQLPGLANEELRIAMGWATAGVMVASNLYQVFRARRYFRDRLDSEGHRLYTRIKREGP